MPKKAEVPEWLIENITEASKNARRIYFLYLGFLGYCALTVVSTSDRQIILNETVSLPILKIDVSLNGFFLLAPLIGIFIFAYFQLYLKIRKKLINRLKRDSPSIEEDRLYPWMLVALDFPGQTVIDRLQSGIVRFSVWYSLPLVMALISTWFVKKHDPTLSYLIGSAPIVGTFIVLWFWFQYDDVKLRIWQTPKHMFDNLGKSILIITVIIYEIAFLFFIIPMANEGFPFTFPPISADVQTSKEIMRRLKINVHLRQWFCVNLSYQKLVAEPKIDYKGLFWGNFNKAHLEGAILINAVLERADLRKAQLQNSFLSYAILKGANLGGANLQEANLDEADLRGASLPGANLQGANLIRANLQKANLWGTNLQEALLMRANLQGANLEKADLRGAKGLNLEQLVTVKTLYFAKLDPELMEHIKKEYLHLLEEPKPE